VDGHDHRVLTPTDWGIRAIKWSLAGLAVTALLQLVIVLVSGSVALLADTVHNFSDCLTAIPLWVAFVIGRRPATKRYSYGYERAEDLAGLFIVLVIAASAAFVAWEAVARLMHSRPVDNLPW
jgi:cation diffusion facilitator family transporter